MKNLFIQIFLFILFQGAEAQNRPRICVLKDSISYSNQYVYMNEISIETSDSDLYYSFYKSINAISLNKFEKTKNAEERLTEKRLLLKQYISTNQLNECPLLAECYDILAFTSEFVNIKYVYSQYGNYQTYNRYVLISLKDGKIFTYDKLFANPDPVLEFLNKQYRINLKKEIYSNEKNEETLEVLEDHYNNFTGFKLVDLENIEFIINEISKKIEKVRFHYDGISGFYNPVWPSGYIEFNIDYISDYMRTCFL